VGRLVSGRGLRRSVAVLGLLVWLLLSVSPKLLHGQQEATHASDALRQEISTGDRIAPQDLAAALKASNGPVVLQVGPRTFYEQAHILGAAYVGAAGTEAGRQALRERVRDLPKDRWIVVYCGCCPWDRCPNIRPAFNQLLALGFTHVQALDLPNNFGADWVAKGYPTEK
jgi:thiosulfate/3-mercaptopyruvate sulfurtransferase